MIFKNFKVIELASVLAGPSVGMFFAELGADVIKIENPSTGGDVTRGWKLPEENSDSDLSAYFCSVNWGKKSIALDLSNNSDHEIFDKLIQTADLLTVSFKPGDAEKFRCDYNSIRTINPNIIYAQITGFGENDDRTAFDAVIQAYSGFMYLNGTPESGPVKMPVALIDILAAHQIKEAVLLAYIKKLKTGEGSFVQTSLLESGIASLANQASNYLNAGFIPQRTGSDHPNIFPYGTLFTTSDKKLIMAAAGTDKQFTKLCGILSIASIAENEKYKTNAQRVKNREALKKILSIEFRKFKSEDLINKLDSAKIPAAKILDMKEVFEQDTAKKLILENFSGKETTKGLKTFTAGKEFSAEKLSPPPHLDQHRKEILSGLK